MKEENKHIIYTAADIERYLTGKMSPAEMHAIEKAALDDDLLADAIDGYASMQQKDWNKELAALKLKLSAVENNPLVPIYKTSFTNWWKAAAAVIIIGSSISIAYFTSIKNKPVNQLAEAKITSDSIAASSNEITIAGLQKPDSISITESKLQQPTVATVNQPENNTTTLFADVNPPVKRNEPFMYQPPKKTIELASKDLAVADNVTDDVKEMQESKKSETSQISKSENENIRAQSSNQVSNNNFNNNSNAGKANNFLNAQVVTANEEPVAFANVNIAKNKTPIQTDELGKFKIPTADSNLDVVVTSVGYKSKNVTLNNTAALNKIVLQPDNRSLSEVVVTSAIAARKKLSTAAVNKVELKDINLPAAIPADGWDEYNKYLSNETVQYNLKNQPPLHGLVTLTLHLKANAEIKKLKIKKSLNDSYDEEAIRIIKQGPKWKLSNNIATSIEVNVVF